MFHELIKREGFTEADVFRKGGHLVAMRSLNREAYLKRRLLWCVDSGAHFEREMHAYGHLLTVIEGTGEVVVEEQALRYKIGDTIPVHTGVWHAFVCVKSPTLVLQTHPPHLQMYPGR